MSAAAEHTRAVRELLAKLGTPDAAGAAAAFVERGPTASETLLRVLARGATLGPEGATGRAVMEDLESCLIALGSAYPETLLQAADGHESLTSNFAFVSALTTIPSEAAASRLLPLLDARSGSTRWLVLEALLRRRDPRAIAHLGKALRDRCRFLRARAYASWMRSSSQRTPSWPLPATRRCARHAAAW